MSKATASGEVREGTAEVGKVWVSLGSQEQGSPEETE